MPAAATTDTNPFLTALRDRVLIFDGAFGTWVQGRDLSADDFGGPALEGCNENLVLTRPDEIALMHSQFFDAGVDAVETATFGAFALVLAEYGIAETTFDLNRRAAEIAREVASGYSTPDRPRFVIGSGTSRTRRCATTTSSNATAC
jgi:5-methyltetrahydrofolate--homocysteine methyltransferase